jgi:TPR repeat protein
MTLPLATTASVPIYDFAQANVELANIGTANYYSCCGKSICGGCVYSFSKSGNIGNCPFCNADRRGKTDEERVEEMMKRVEANDAGSIYQLANDYYHGDLGLLQDQERAMELWKQAADLGYSKAHYHLGIHDAEGNSKKEKFHYEAAAMAGHEAARYNLGITEEKSGKQERAVKHWMIAASAGHHYAMDTMRDVFEKGLVNRDAIDSILTAYNNSCAEMQSEARDAYIVFKQQQR